MIATLSLVLTLTASAPPPGGARGLLHPVKSGDSYDNLALRYYGSIHDAAWIARRNRLQRPLHEARQLIMPSMERLELGAGESLEAFAQTHYGSAKIAAYLRLLLRLGDGPVPEGQALWLVESVPYVVKTGDSLAKISQRFYDEPGTRRMKLIQLYNGLPSGRIYVGQALRLPMDFPRFALSEVMKRLNAGVSEAEIRRAPPKRSPEPKAPEKARRSEVPETKRDLKSAKPRAKDKAARIAKRRAKEQQKAKEKAARIAKQRAEAERKAKEKREAKEKAARVAKQKADDERKVKEKREAKEKAARLAKQKADEERKAKEQREAKEKAAHAAEAARQAELQAKQKAEAEAENARAQQALKQVQDAYRKGQYQLAIQKAKAAQKAHSKADASTRVALFRLEAYAKVARQDTEGAVLAFRKALRIAPKMELDPREVSPKILRAFREAKEKR